MISNGSVFHRAPCSPILAELDCKGQILNVSVSELDAVINNQSQE
jgi:hypothetical protein